MLKLITSAEHHFNNLCFNIRALASTWLMATFIGVGWVLKDLPESASALLVAKPELIAALCGCSALGILVLWLLDLKVYQQLLNVWFDSRQLYEDGERYPEIRSRMKELFSHGRATQYIRYYYMTTCSAPLLFALYILISSGAATYLLVCALVALLTLNLVIFLSSPIDREQTVIQ